MHLSVTQLLHFRIDAALSYSIQREEVSDHRLPINHILDDPCPNHILLRQKVMLDLLLRELVVETILLLLVFEQLVNSRHVFLLHLAESALDLGTFLLRQSEFAFVLFQAHVCRAASELAEDELLSVEVPLHVVTRHKRRRMRVIRRVDAILDPQQPLPSEHLAEDYLRHLLGPHLGVHCEEVSLEKLYFLSLETVHLREAHGAGEEIAIGL